MILRNEKSCRTYLLNHRKSPPLQLNALVWLKECMLYKETGGETRSHVGLRNRTSGPRKGTETKRKELRKKSGF